LRCLLEEHEEVREKKAKVETKTAAGGESAKDEKKSQYAVPHCSHLFAASSLPPNLNEEGREKEGGIGVCSINGLEGEQVRQFHPRSDPERTLPERSYADRRDKIVGVSSSPRRDEEGGVLESEGKEGGLTGCEKLDGVAAAGKRKENLLRVRIDKVSTSNSKTGQRQ